MYHRVLFNFYCLLMVLINAVGTDGTESEMQTLIALHYVLTIVWCLAIILNRPYRAFSSNMVYILAFTGFS